jgi:cardiolipin synthase
MSPRGLPRIGRRPPSKEGAPAGPLVEQPISTGLHALLLLPGMPRVIASIEADVRASLRRVLVETYIYHDRRFARELLGAAHRGAAVRLLYDALGSHLAERRFFERLRASGVGARAYRPAGVVAREIAPFPRDHSRVVVTDTAAYTGGAAWADQWLPRRLGGDGWYDVCLRVEGPVVEDFAELFEQRWREANGEAPPADFTTGDRYPDLTLVGDAPSGPSLVEQHYRDAIRRAKSRVWIENAYFFPGEAMLSDLVGAAARGVDVQIIVPGKTDLPIVKRAARAEMASWLERGLQVLEYQATYLHSKLAVVDDSFCTVGTFNMNPTSTAWANEVSLFVRDPAFVARVARQFEIDRSLSRRVRPGDPELSPSLVDRVVDYLSAGVLRLLDRAASRP